MKLLKQRTDAENLGRYKFNPDGAKVVKKLTDTPENREKLHKIIIDSGKRGKWRIIYDNGEHLDVFVFGRNEYITKKINL